MKKIKLLSLILSVMMLAAFGLAACQKDFEPFWEDDGETILIGNTAATTGGYAMVGVPFNMALEAYLDHYNKDMKAAGDRTVKFKHHDDNFEAAKGVTNTEKLVEDDKVFALVGHFGTPTVGATLNYIKESRVPMVYAATGIADLFNAEAKGDERYILPVQPIFTTEGAIFAARATSKDPAVGLGLTKIGVIYTNDDAGLAMKGQIDAQMAKIKAVSGFSAVTVDSVQVSATSTAADAPAAVASLKAKGVECVIMAANQVPTTAIANAMLAGGLEVPMLSSYVNATTAFVAGLAEGIITPSRLLYTNSWVDLGLTGSETALAELSDFYTIMKEHAVVGSTGFVLEETHDPANAADLRNNAFAMAGYIAAHIFIQGLQRTITATEGKITQAAYIDAMEASPVKAPLGGTLNFANGARLGLDRLSFFAYGADKQVDYLSYKDFADLATMMTKLNAPA